MKIEIAYALPDKQTVIAIEVEADCSILAAIQHSGILTKFPEINLEKAAVGIFGKKCKLSDRVHEGGRIEIYRPLLIDPKEARRARAKKLTKKSK